MIIGFCLMLLFFAYTGVTAPESLAQAEEWLFAMLLGYPLGLTELIEQVLWMSGLFLLGLGVTGSLICSALDVRTEVTKS
jgi:hypothetical protein